MSRTTRGSTVAAVAGAATMIVGALGPWATAQSVLGQGVAKGMDHGGLVVVLLALLIAVLALADRPTLLGVCALVAAIWIAMVMYSLPGVLVDSGSYRADITWGAFLALAGCFVALAAAIRRERTLVT